MLIPSCPLSEMVKQYSLLNLLAIPSVWLETGPLTLLEALQMNVVVYGTETIGQKQILEEYGKVIRPNTVESWRKALTLAIEKHRTGTFLALRPPRIRTMEDVANEMRNTIYKCDNLAEGNLLK